MSANKGAVGGGVVGFFVGGPVGALLGAAAGGYLGKRYADQQAAAAAAAMTDGGAAERPFNRDWAQLQTPDRAYDPYDPNTW